MANPNQHQIVTLTLLLLCTATAIHLNPEGHTLSSTHFQSSAYSQYDNSLSAILDGLNSNPASVPDSSRLPYADLTNQTCRNLSPQETKKLQGKIPTVQRKLNESPFSSCCNETVLTPEQEKSRTDLQNQKVYVQAVKDLLDSKCNASRYLVQVAYQTNLQADNWIYGGKTKEDLRREVIDRSQNNPAVVNCPLDHPFKADRCCIDCPKERPIFNLATSNCQACPAGTSYDRASRSCKGQPRVNPKEDARVILQPGQQIPDAANKCPFDKPFPQRGKCIQCNAPKNLFDLSKQQCASCGQLYQAHINNKTHLCQDWHNEPYYTNLSAPNLVNGGMPSSYWQYAQDQYKKANPGVKPCPNPTPYWNDTNCIPCKEPKPYFNLATRQCQPCNGTYVYSEKDRDCINTDGNGGVQGSIVKMTGSLLTHNEIQMHEEGLIQGLRQQHVISTGSNHDER